MKRNKISPVEALLISDRARKAMAAIENAEFGAGISFDASGHLAGHTFS